MVTVRKKNVSRFAGETLESLLFGFIYSVNWSWVPGWESKSRNVEVRHAKENEECLKEEWEQLARFSSNPEGLAQFGDLNSNMFSTYFPVLQSMKIYMKRQWTENRKGLPGGKERRLDNWIGDLVRWKNKCRVGKSRKAWFRMWVRVCMRKMDTGFHE